MNKKKYLNVFFYSSLIIKGFDGTIETIAGLWVWKHGIGGLKYLALAITQQELLEDPKDFIANWIIMAANNLSINTQLLIVYFLLSHGIIKLVLTVLLYKKQKWAYPLAIALFGLAATTQTIRLVASYSTILTIITIIDILVILTIWSKYLTLNREKNAN